MKPIILLAILLLSLSSRAENNFQCSSIESALKTALTFFKNRPPPPSAIAPPFQFQIGFEELLNKEDAYFNLLYTYKQNDSQETHTMAGKMIINRSNCKIISTSEVELKTVEFD